MCRLSIAAVAAVFTVAVVQISAAADLPRKAPSAPPPPPVYNWTGFYVGGNAGYVWGNSDITSSYTCPSGGCTYTLPANLSAISGAGTGSLSADGFTGGVQAGYNWQTGNIVFGAEMDFNAFDLNASRAVGGLIPIGAGQSFTVTTGVDTNWLFTARGRVGWTVTPMALLYVTGGLAVTNLNVSNAFIDTFVVPASAASTHNTTKTGWTVGVGLEWAFAQRWTVKVEYLYVDFGSVSTTAFSTGGVPAGGNVFATSADLTANIGRLGVNYRF